MLEVVMDVARDVRNVAIIVVGVGDVASVVD